MTINYVYGSGCDRKRTDGPVRSVLIERTIRSLSITTTQNHADLVQVRNCGLYVAKVAVMLPALPGQQEEPQGRVKPIHSQVTLWVILIQYSYFLVN